MAEVDDPGASALLPAERRGAGLWGPATSAIAALSGLAPHVLPHVGPTAGAPPIGGAAAEEPRLDL